MEQILSNFEKRVNPKIELEKKEKAKLEADKIQYLVKCKYYNFLTSNVVIFSSLFMFIFSCRIEILIINNEIGSDINDLPMEIATSIFTFFGAKFCIIVLPILIICMTIYALNAIKTANKLNDKLENKVILKEYFFEWLQSN